MRSRWIILGLLCLSGVGLRAQDGAVTLARFFSIAPARSPVTTATEDGKMPWIERYELRTRTRDFDPDQQEYTFRIMPSTRAKVRAQEALYRHLTAAQDFNAEEDRCDLLQDRYSDWTEMYFLARRVVLLAERETVQADRATVLNRMAASGEVEWSALVKLRQNQTDNALQRTAVNDRARRIAQSYALDAGDFDFADWPDLGRIRSRVGEQAYVATDPEAAYELETVSRELALERAEDRQYVDFAQLRYRGPHDNPINERLSVGVGLQLPNDGNRKLKLRELELEAEQIRAEQLRKTAAGTTDFDLRRQVLLDDLERYAEIQARYAAEATDLRAIASRMSQRAGVDPLPLLDIEARRIGNQLALLKLEQELYDDYLELMRRAGTLCLAEAGELYR